MEQPDLFGDSAPVVTHVRMPVQFADATRVTGYTCWKDCGHCNPELLTQNSHGYAARVYRLCDTVGCKCFPNTDICKWSTHPASKTPSKPPDPAWVDY